MTANMFGYFSANSTARRLLSIEVPIVMMRVTPASSARRNTSVEVRREIRIIKMSVSFYDCISTGAKRMENLRFVERFDSKESRLSLATESAILRHYHSITVLAQVSPPPNTTIRM